MSHLFGKQISQLIDQQKPEPCKYTQSAKCVNQLNISIIIIWVSVINSVQYQQSLEVAVRKFSIAKFNV